MERRLICHRCKTILQYDSAATSVYCGVCTAITPVPPPGMEMAQITCGGCLTLLMHPRGVGSVTCACCYMVNLVPGYNDIARVNCVNCRRLLTYASGSSFVRCVICQFTTIVGAWDTGVPIPRLMPSGSVASPSATWHPPQ